MKYYNLYLNFPEGYYNFQDIDHFLYSLTLTKFWKWPCIVFVKKIEEKELIYSLQFGFGQKQSTAHVLIHLIDEIRNTLGRGNNACGK